MHSHTIDSENWVKKVPSDRNIIKTMPIETSATRNSEPLNQQFPWFGATIVSGRRTMAVHLYWAQKVIPINAARRRPAAQCKLSYERSFRNRRKRTNIYFVEWHRRKCPTERMNFATKGNIYERISIQSMPLSAILWDSFKFGFSHYGIPFIGFGDASVQAPDTAVETARRGR